MWGCTGHEYVPWADELESRLVICLKYLKTFRQRFYHKNKWIAQISILQKKRIPSFIMVIGSICLRKASQFMTWGWIGFKNTQIKENAFSHVCMYFYSRFKEWLSIISRNWVIWTLQTVKTWWVLHFQAKFLQKIQNNKQFFLDVLCWWPEENFSRCIVCGWCINLIGDCCLLIVVVACWLLLDQSDCCCWLLIVGGSFWLVMSWWVLAGSSGKQA